jgi:hypothetical protein
MFEMIESDRPLSPLFADEYYYRRSLTPREVLPALGVGVGIGLIAFYVAKILLERTPLRPERRPSVQRPSPIIRPSMGGIRRSVGGIRRSPGGTRRPVGG